jgi:hypothetical protein
MNQVEKWRLRNISYYESIEKICLFYISGKAKILEIGSGLGILLSKTNPQKGVGVEKDPDLFDISSGKFPDLSFVYKTPEAFRTNDKFDYVLMANSVSSLDNIQQVFSNIHQSCLPSTRLIITFQNPSWELILKLASFIKQRMPYKALNWLTYDDVRNILDLEGFEVIIHSKKLLVPRKIPILDTLFNKILAQIPFFNQLCLIEFIVARLKPNHFKTEIKTSESTCSVIIPARNEAGNIEQCVTRMPFMGKHTEIIFIEGNSIDNTWNEIQRIQEKYKDHWDIKISQQKGKGKGDAVRQGFTMATGDILIILDSDLTVKPEDLTYFFEAIASGNCEFANGCRLVYPVNSETMPWINQLANRLFAWLLSYLLNTTIKDSLCGTKALSKQNYLRIAANRHYFGDFDPFGDFDLLFGASKLGLKVQDIPVRYMPRTYGSSNINHIKEGLVLLKMCIYAARKVKFL